MFETAEDGTGLGRDGLSPGGQPIPEFSSHPEGSRGGVHEVAARRFDLLPGSRSGRENPASGEAEHFRGQRLGKAHAVGEGLEQRGTGGGQAGEWSLAGIGERQQIAQLAQSVLEHGEGIGHRRPDPFAQGDEQLLARLEEGGVPGEEGAHGGKQIPQGADDRQIQNRLADLSGGVGHQASDGGEDAGNEIPDPDHHIPRPAERGGKKIVDRAANGLETVQQGDVAGQHLPDRIDDLPGGHEGLADHAHGQQELVDELGRSDQGPDDDLADPDHAAHHHRQGSDDERQVPGHDLQRECQPLQKHTGDGADNRAEGAPGRPIGGAGGHAEDLHHRKDRAGQRRIGAHQGADGRFEDGADAAKGMGERAPQSGQSLANAVIGLEDGDHEAQQSGGFELLGQFGRHLPDAAAERAHQLPDPPEDQRDLVPGPGDDILDAAEVGFPGAFEQIHREDHARDDRGDGQKIGRDRRTHSGERGADGHEPGLDGWKHESHHAHGGGDGSGHDQNGAEGHG